MFSRISDAWHLYRLERKIIKVYKEYDEDLKKAKKDNDRDKINELLYMRDVDCEE